MKNWTVILALLLSVSSYAQKSYEFGVTLPVEVSPTTSVDPRFYANYEGATSEQYYEVNQNGIYYLTINIQAISKETIRETGKYFVRNEHIFGVTKDSIPCVFENDNYYFGIRNRVQIAGDSTENKLIPLSDGLYIVNLKSEHGYIPALFQFTNQQLSVAYFDYEDDSKLFRRIKEKEEQLAADSGIITVILKPSGKEWEKLAKKELFGKEQVYPKLTVVEKQTN